MLHMIQYGGSNKPPLLIAHGLFGSARNWTAIAKRLAAERPVIAVDLRNHGASPHEPSHRYQDLAADLAEIIQSTGGACDVLGHSMGGKAAMFLALTQPQIVRKLIVVDIAPVDYAHTQAPVIKAMQSLDLARISTRRDADAQLAEAIREPEVRAFLLQSLDLRGDRPRWILNLDALAANMAQIMAFPKTDACFKGPVLVISGGNSDYVRASHHQILGHLFPRVEIHEIAGAGHWVQVEKPNEFISDVRDFLAK